MMTEQPGLRERKKAKTRALIMQVASELFVERGFDEVTLEAIAERCEVSVRTVLRYFDSKESLALAADYDAFERFADGLAQRDGDVVAYWREHVAKHANANASYASKFRRHVSLIAKHPALSARDAKLQTEYEDALAEAIAEEIGDDEGIRSRLLAAMLVAGNSAVARHVLARRQPLDPDTFLRVVDYAAAAFAKMPASPPTPGRRTR